MNLVQMEMNEWEGGFWWTQPLTGERKRGTPGSRWNGPQLWRGWEDGWAVRREDQRIDVNVFEVKAGQRHSLGGVEKNRSGKFYRGLWQTKLLIPNSNIYRLLQDIVGNQVYNNLVKMEDSFREAVAEKTRNVGQSQIVKVLSCQSKELGPSKGKRRVFGRK